MQNKRLIEDRLDMILEVGNKYHSISNRNKFSDFNFSDLLDIYIFLDEDDKNDFLSVLDEENREKIKKLEDGGLV